MQQGLEDKIIKTGMSEIWLDEEKILWIQTMDDGVLDLEEVKKCFEAYKSLGIENNKVLQLMIVSDGVSMNHEARQYVTENARNFFKASAIVSNSLAVRLLVNFFNIFYRHEVPFRMFGNVEDAKLWLSKFRS